MEQMQWVQIAIAAGALVLGLIIAAMFVGFKKERRLMASITAVCVAAALGAGAWFMLMPIIKEKNSIKQAMIQFDQNPAIAVLKQYDQNSYLTYQNDMRARVTQAVKEGKSTDDLTDELLGSLHLHARKMVPVASDEAAMQYVTAMADVVSTLQKKDIGACYKFVNGGVTITGAFNKYLSAQQLQNLYNSFATVFKTGITEPVEPPYTDEVREPFEMLAKELVQVFGAEILQVFGKNRQSVEQSRLCAMEAAIWRMSAKNTSKDAAKAFKYIISEVNKRDVANK